MGVGGWWCFLSMVIVVKLGEQYVHVLVPVGYRVEMHVHVPTHACSMFLFILRINSRTKFQQAGNQSLNCVSLRANLSQSSSAGRKSR